MLNDLVNLLHNHFATDQSYHAEQQADGIYKKKSGMITPQFLKKTLEQCGSIAVYQKNADQTIKWICFDFDILKINLQEGKIEKARVELNRAVSYFCQSLNEINIPYLLEYSGNRGFHIWITFTEKTSYRIGFDIQQALLEKIDINYNKELIAIDLFPKTGTPTKKEGSCLKIPLSKHKKSGNYALILSSKNEINLLKIENNINDEIIKKHIEILKAHKSISKSEIENSLGIFFDLTHDELFYPTRIKSIKINNSGFTLNDLMCYWNNYPPLKRLGEKIEEKNLNNDERKLLVGLFGNIQCKKDGEISNKLLHEIFSKTENYNKEKTQNAIKSLSSFFFPSQEQIEIAIGIKFEKKYTIDELLDVCIPKYSGNYEDATFDISIKDIEVTKVAELNYLYLNDEAQSKVVINELSTINNEELFENVKYLIKSPKNARHYKHTRNEGSKNRTLVTLKTTERIITSCILKQLIYFFDIQPNNNSHGYNPNKGFKGGYIFQPWLYLWIKFLSNISSAIEDSDNQDYYIVKSDIKGFYDNIPHDRLKRVLLGDGNEIIHKKLSNLSEISKNLYDSYIDTIFNITETITNSKKGLPQGPAYARYLAELYLDNIDIKLDSKIKDGTLQLYQRYVDDFFFVAPTEVIARATLKQLESDLQLLGLELNTEKTVIKKIRNFSDDFDIYRSQSKYAVDKVSKNFMAATETQKNLAINEFMTLIQSDSCDEDLAFIFSHLDSVPQFEKWKKEKVIPVLETGIGRGSIYKHLFNFVLDIEDNWGLFNKIDKFTELQSEVLTSAFINAIEVDESKQQNLNKLIESLLQKLTITEFVEEHLVYLAVTFDTKIDLDTINPTTIINCLKSISNVENLKITSNLVECLNTALNDIKSLSDFVKAIYPLCASINLKELDLNNLAGTFYAKVSKDYDNNIFLIDNQEINSGIIARKFYYLLCLFSISNKNNSDELLGKMWKYCAELFSKYDCEAHLDGEANWFKKIGDRER